MNLFKKITGITFLFFGFLGVLMCLSFIFNWNWFDRDFHIFGRAYDGDSSSNSPAFFGLIAIAGALILGQIKEESNIDYDEP